MARFEKCRLLRSSVSHCPLGAPAMLWGERGWIPATGLPGGRATALYLRPRFTLKSPLRLAVSLIPLQSFAFERLFALPGLPFSPTIPEDLPDTSNHLYGSPQRDAECNKTGWSSQACPAISHLTAPSFPLGSGFASMTAIDGSWFCAKSSPS